MFETMADSLKPMMPLISLVGSTASLGITSYFWFVKANREKARLLCDSVPHVTFVDLHQCTDETRWLNFQLGLVVVNESSLPNAVLNAKVFAKSKKNGLQEMTDVRPVPGTNFPVNLPPMQSGMLKLEWYLSLPYSESAENSGDPAAMVKSYLKENWTASEELRVQLQGLHGQCFTCTVPLVGSHMSTSIRERVLMQERSRAA